MTRQQRTDLSISISSLVQQLLGAQAPVQGRPDFRFEALIEDGLGEGKGNVVMDFSETLADAAIRDVDVHDFANTNVGQGLGKDSLGQAVALSGVILLAIRNKSNTGVLLVGGKGGATAWISPFNANVDENKVQPGGIMLLYAGGLRYPVVDTTNHILQLEASGGEVDFDFFLIGN